MRVLLVYAGLSPGGITADLRNLEHGLHAHGVDVAVAGELAEVHRQTREGDVLVHVFSCLPSATTFGAMVLAKARNLPLVWTPVFHPSRPRSWVGYGPLRVMEVFDRIAPRAARFADGVIAATEAEAEHFRRLGARCAVTIAPAVEKASARSGGVERARARANFGLGDEPTVLVVARPENSRRKGLPFARAAFRALRTRLPNARLLLLGHQPGDGLAREMGALAAGWCGPARVAQAYDAADMLMVSSIYEGLPRAVVEAWSHELPVAVTDRVALAPLVQGRAGRVVRFGDVPGMASALEMVLTSDSLARRYGAGGRALVEGRFLLTDHVRRTMALYRWVGGL
ncbi:MAG: glycosyltransferase family 4 protein [Streptosporangiaceae bacterium]